MNSNASAGNVQYTQIPPTYSNEAGFLNSFSTTDKNAIATTKHRVMVSYADGVQGGDTHIADGGSVDITSGFMMNVGPTIPFAYANEMNSYENWRYQLDNDKVYLLTLDDAYRLVEARGLSLSRPLTSVAAQKEQTSSLNREYWINFPEGYSDGWKFNHTLLGNSDGTLNTVGSEGPTTPEAVVPTLYVKPDTNFNGTKASDLKIGSTVSFGNYLGQAIQWQVINKVNGYAQLLVTNAIDLKAFDNSGDYSYAKSNYINYSTADVDVSSMPIATTNGSNNTTLPSLTITDDSPLYARQNSPYSMHFKVSAIGTGNSILYTKLPDGSTTTASEFDYTFSENKTYYFKTYDSAGNVTDLAIPVSNINAPSSVMITPSTENWTNKPVTVDIKANNDVGASNLSWTGSTRDKFLYVSPNYASYSGRQIHVHFVVTGYGTPTGTAHINGAISPMLYYKALNKSQGQYVLIHQWLTNYDGVSYGPPFPYSDLLTSGVTKTIDQTITVPSNYNNNLQIGFHMETPWTDLNYPFKVTDFSVNLITDDDFKINSITLPNGTVVNSNSYTDTLTNNGTYTYSVLDSRSQTTKKTVTVNIDKIAPTINITGAPSTVVNTDVPLTATTADTGGSGVAQIQSPAGEWSTNSSLSYTANEEGNHTYTFGVKDNAGNVTNKSVTINIDKTAPTATITGNPTSTIHTPTTLNLTSSDENSGVQQVQTPDGVWHSGSTASYKVTENGNYTFKVQDKAGNIKTQTVNVTNIGSLAYVYNNDSGSLISDDSATISTANLNGKSQTLTTNTHQMQFGDTLGNNWQLSLNANQLSSGSHTLPTGTLILNKLNYTDNNSMLSNLLTSPTAIDDKKDKTILSSTKQSTNSYDLNPDYSVKIPANAYKGTYKTIINWKLNE